MAHTAHSPSRPSLKLSNVHHAGRHQSIRNEWLASDRFERWRLVIIVAILVAVFAAGAVLIISGLTR
jgi:hypothetical protein